MSGPSHPGLPSLVVAKAIATGRRKGLVQREALVARLGDREDRAVTLVRAPAGYGKTTLAAQWVEHDNARRFGWVGLGSAENDPVVLWRYIFAAIRSLVPGTAERAWLRLNGPAPDITEVVTGLLNDLVSVEDRLVVILDDYHVIENPTCHTSIQFFIDHLPRTIQIALISRERPPLRLSRLAAHGLVSELDLGDLRFTPDETAAAMQQIAHSVTTEHAAAVHERTEGWPAGVYMSAVGWDAPSDGSGRSIPATAQITRYLMDEMLGQLSNDDRALLRETSVLDRFNGELCDYVTGGTGAAKRIADLANANLLLVPLGEHDGWYRCHHLLRESLLAELKEHERQLKARLHARAMEWWLENGDPSRAIHHAIDAGLLVDAADLICAHWPDLVFSGQIATAHRWLRRYPDHKMLEYPPLLVAAAWISALRGDAVRTRSLARAASRASYEGAMPDGTASYESSTAIVRAALGLDGVREALGAAERAAVLEPATSRWYPYAVVLTGTTRGMLGEAGAADALSEAIARSSGVDGVSTYAYGQFAVLAAWSDDWNQAAEWVQRGLDLIEEFDTDDLVISGAVRAIAAGTAARDGDMGIARQRLRSMAALLKGLSDAIPFDAMQIHLLISEVYEQLGDPSAAVIHANYAAGRLVTLGDAGVMADRLDALLARLSEQAPQALIEPEDVGSLTARERQILRLLSTSMSLREIGHELYVSRNTVKTHVSNIYRKLDVSSRTAAVARAQEMELI